MVVRERRTFTVVGFYERPGFEPFIAPGYTALTVEDNNAFSSYDYDVYIKTKKMSGIIDFMDEKFQGHGRRINDDLLRFSGVIYDPTFKGILYGLAGILIALICSVPSCLYTMLFQYPSMNGPNNLEFWRLSVQPGGKC